MEQGKFLEFKFLKKTENNENKNGEKTAETVEKLNLMTTD